MHLLIILYLSPCISLLSIYLCSNVSVLGIFLYFMCLSSSRPYMTLSRSCISVFSSISLLSYKSISTAMFRFIDLFPLHCVSVFPFYICPCVFFSSSRVCINRCTCNICLFFNNNHVSKFLLIFQICPSCLLFYISLFRYIFCFSLCLGRCLSPFSSWCLAPFSLSLLSLHHLFNQLISSCCLLCIAPV